jgi:hypothetical protein
MRYDVKRCSFRFADACAMRLFHGDHRPLWLKLRERDPDSPPVARKTAKFFRTHGRAVREV